MSLQSVENFRDLMGKIGQIENFGIVVGYEGHLVWQVVVDHDDKPIMLEIDETRQVVVFSSEVGVPSEEEAGKVAALALDYSGPRASTGGVRIGRNNSDGSISVIMDYALEGLSRENLGNELRRIAKISSGWSDIVAGVRDGANGNGISVPGDFMLRA